MPLNVCYNPTTLLTCYIEMGALMFNDVGNLCRVSTSTTNKIQLL